MALYNTPFGKSEIGGSSKTNAMGQTVYTSGGAYDSQGNKITMNPIGGGLYGWYTSGSSGSSGGSGGSYISLGGGGYSTPKLKEKDYAILNYQSAIDTLQGGVTAAEDAVKRNQSHITNAQTDLDAARKAAAGIGTAITNVNSSALSLNPFIKSLWEQGDSQLSLYDQLMSGNAVSGSAADKYLQAVGLAGDAALNITPDRYVSMAASDVQGSFDNAQGQFQRALSRQGIDAGSGAGLSGLQKQFTQSLSTALAAAKTRARQQGISEQISALTQRAGLYKDVLNQAQSVQQQGTQNIAQAAGLVQAQGDMFATAGSLGATQVNSFANIGGVEVNLGQLELQNNEAVQNALEGVAAAQQAMAKFYADIMPVTERGYSGGKYTSMTTTKG